MAMALYSSAWICWTLILCRFWITETATTWNHSPQYSLTNGWNTETTRPRNHSPQYSLTSDWNAKNTSTSNHLPQYSSPNDWSTGTTNVENLTQNSTMYHQSTIKRSTHNSQEHFYHWNKETTSAEEFLVGFNPGVCRDGRYITQFKKTDPVMYPCECTPGCEMYGTCCPDNATDLVSDSYTSCVKSGWYVISKCPAGWSNTKNDKKGCERSSWRGGYPIENLVSDPRTNITYRNEHCALCHGVSSFTRWTINVSCHDFQTMYSAVTEEELLRLAVVDYLNCFVGNSPPDGVQPRQCKNNWNDVIIDKCRRHAKDKDVVANCGLYKALFLTVKRGAAIFQNLFCYMCNGYVLIRNSYRGTRPAFVAPPLSLLLGLTDRAVHLEDQADRDCQTGQLLDLKNMFQNLTCLAGKVLVNCTCVTAISQIRGLAYYLNITVRPSELLLISDSNRSVFHAALVQKVKTKLVELARKLSLTIVIASSPISQTPEIEEIVQIRITGEVHAKGNISRDDAEFPLVRNVFHTDWDVVVNDRTVRLSRQYLSQETSARTTLPVRYKSSSKPIPMRVRNNMLVLSPMLACPYLEFNQSQYELQAAGDRGKNTRLLLTFTEVEAEVTDLWQTWMDGGYLYLCYDVLKSLSRPDRGQPFRGSAVLDWQYVLTMVMMPLSMLCLLLTLAEYCLLPALRTQPGLNTMCTCTALLLAQLSLLVAVHAHGTTARPWCQVLGAVVHAAWLSVFCWISICSVHMFRAFSAETFHHGSLSSLQRYMETARNIMISVLVPAFIIGAVMAVRFVTTNGRSVGYSEVSCYLESTLLVGVSMVLPASLLLLLNMTLFILTVRRIQEVTEPHARSENEQESQHHVYTCARLSLLTSFTWVISLAAEGLNVDWLQVIAILANGGQGVLLLLSHVTTHSVAATLAVKLGWKRREEPSC